MAVPFTTINPVSTGLAGKIGATVLYVSTAGGAATSYTKYGTGNTDWCATPAMGGGEVVTADPRSSGLARDIGARALYVTGGVGTLLRKYGFGATEWCTWDPPGIVATGSVALTDLADLATDRLIGRDTASTGAPEALTVGGGLEFTGSGGLQRSALTGDVTASAGSGATTIPPGTVTYAKLQDISATSRLLGRKTSGAGDAEEVTASEAIDFIGTTRGAVLYRGASGWALLAPGDASTILTSAGSGADPSWAAPASSAPRTYVVLGSDFVTDQSSAQNVTDFKFTPGASKTYVIEGQFGVSTTNFGIGAQPGATWPTGYSNGWIEVRAPNATSGADDAVQLATAGTGVAVTGAVNLSTTGSWPASVRATLITGASPSGDFQITLQAESGGNNVTMRAGSWIAYREIP